MLVSFNLYFRLKVTIYLLKVPGKKKFEHQHKLRITTYPFTNPGTYAAIISKYINIGTGHTLYTVGENDSLYG
ncbi:hypothetical protein SAMN05660236_3605 [Ohtaekwangia koreensis]|uniref:Uncharacterized protein n=1 Tax=Ohtaekwangia koreensis TaxID=688867 RepID=A0A1T5LNJ7_9BACT|nr:hypothetical protein SAMN05660236_3605 [Ohtaekwangia koreensis]